VLDADALAECVVSLDGGGEFALGIECEGELDVVVLCVVLSELAQDVERGDGGLAGKDGVAIIVAQLLAFGVEPAGIDGGLEAPRMEWEGEVVANPGDVVFGCGVFEDDVGVGAVGALHVFEFNDGYTGADGGFERGGVVYRGGGGCVELGAHTRRRGEQSDGKTHRESNAASREAKGEGKISRHIGLDDSLVPIVTATNEESCRLK